MEHLNKTYNSVLTIAGSDSGGCAGIQADIKSISACGAFAASVITATTAQNTQGVTDIHAIPIPHLEKQLDAVLSDISFNAIKIGMLHSCEVISTVQQKLDFYPVKNIVIDPVMVTTSGHQLIAKDAIVCLKQFLPKATLITPNIPEAVLLLGKDISLENMESAAKEIGQNFNTSVLLKGGHLTDTQTLKDVLYMYPTDTLKVIENPKIETHNTHGTGCSLSSSIATFLCLQYDLETAVQKGITYLHHAIKSGAAISLGKGKGPVNHFDL